MSALRDAAREHLPLAGYFFLLVLVSCSLLVAIYSQTKLDEIRDLKKENRAMIVENSETLSDVRKIVVERQSYLKRLEDRIQKLESRVK
jgi:uncharacterized protein YlxW (UPF0749 family)